MRFDLFEKLSASEAQELLRQFIEDGAAYIDRARGAASESGVTADFRMESLPQFLYWTFQQLRTVPKNPDLSVPAWIRSTPEYEKGLFEFDDDSKTLICIVAYYFGECFVRNYPQLRWATGNPEYAEGNMPVVTGFAHNQELSPMLVLKNLFSRIIKEPERKRDIAVAIDTWRNDIE